MGARFTCTDSNARFEGRQLSATNDWKKDHNNRGWKNYITTQYDFIGANKVPVPRDPDCNVDEWPPAYFRDAQNSGQLVRYLPGSENKGVANLWGAFCKNNDGGNGNGQEKDGKLNKNLVKPKNHLGSHEVTVRGTTTTYVSYSAEYTRAVFSMDFKWDGSELGRAPDDSNSWGLDRNPCWPQAIVPNDPGYCLNTNDPWYNNHVPNPDLRMQYSQQPSPQVIKSAEAWLKRHNEVQVQAQVGSNPAPKRPPPGGSGSTPGPKKGPTNPPAAGHKRSLDLLEDGLLAIRDDEFNVTRRLTDEEIKRDIEVIQCADRTCSKERRSYANEEGVIFIPGSRPAMSPPESVEAVATVVAGPATTLERRTVERRSPSPEFPEATTAPAQ